MVKAIYQAARNLQFKTQNIELVANNLANINTTGFKRSLPFSEILTRERDNAYKQLSDFSEGVTSVTTNPLDVAIRGEGFFVVKTDQGMELTRDGRFHISEEGYLVTSHGHRVMGQKGEINMYEALVDKSKTIDITKDGEIMLGDVSIDKLVVGKIEDQRKVLRSQTQDFQIVDGSFTPAPETDYKITQGYVEESNVNPIIEMQSMITLNKDFESAQKIIGFFDASLGKASEVGKV